MDFDQKLEVAANLLKEQQATVLGISVPGEQNTEEELEKLQQVLVNYDSGVGLPTGSE